MIPLSLMDLGIAAALMLSLGAISLWQRLGLVRELFIATARMGIQLSLIGYVLKALFAQRNVAWVLGVGLVMVAIAGREIMARQRYRLIGGRSWGIGTVSLLVSNLTVWGFALVVMVQAEPWYLPQYAIPLLGMLLGNTMTGIALSMDRFTNLLFQERDLIEQRLMLGGTAREATAELVRESLRGGLMPTVNAMAVAGVVSLPGMMTGQMLSGVSPTLAVRYQIFIWLLIAVSTGWGMVVALEGVRRRCFDARDRLRLDSLQEWKKR